METISALMDGELGTDQTGRELSRLKRDPGLRETWDTFHLIGDAMRGNLPLSAGFESGLAQRLAQEPTVLAPQRRTTPRLPTAVSYALSAAASLSAVAVVAWVALSGTGGAPGTTAAPGLAQAPVAAPAPAAPLLAATPLPNVPDDGRTHDYLLAHQGVSPSTALQGVAPYVRTVTVSRTGAR